MNSPLVSIIIPTFNRVNLIGETLDSLINQTYKNWECLVIDDGSEDATEELLEFYCQQDYRFYYYQRPLTHQKGANACRNYGFELSKGELINWYDSDDLMDQKKLEIQVESLCENKFDFSICESLVFVGDISNIVHRHKNIHSIFPFEDYLKQKVKWMTPSALWKRSFLNNHKLFDENLMAAQEWEFHTRMLFFSSRCSVIKEPLVYIREHQESITYGKLKGKTLWHYFLARYKIYTNKEILLNQESHNYLRNYLLSHFRRMIRNKRYKDTVTAYYLLGIKGDVVKIGSSFSALLSFFSFAIFRKGEYFLKNVK